MAGVYVTMATFSPLVVSGLGRFRSSPLGQFARVSHSQIGSLCQRNWRRRMQNVTGTHGRRNFDACSSSNSVDSRATVRGDEELVSNECSDFRSIARPKPSTNHQPGSSTEYLKTGLTNNSAKEALDFEQRSSSLDAPSFLWRFLGLAPKVVQKVADKRTQWVTVILALKEKCMSSVGKPSDLVVFLTSLAIVLSVMTTGSDSLAFVAAPPRKLQKEELATVQLFKENTPSVVYITNLAVRRDVFTLDVMAVPQGSGSGFIWDKDGHIVTNYHVIRGASDLRVTLADQSVYEADVVGYDEDKDVAVLHIDAPEEKLRPLPVGSSSDLLVGQKVYAIGNPFGLDHTLTTGVISGLRREISSAATGRPIQDVIQTDAAINPGNSGGPLLDSSGTLIGINTAIYSPSGTSSGVGFSIPVDTVSGIVEQIVKYGKVTRPVLGISFAPEQSVEQLGVTGVLVLDAPPTGPAGKAGLRPTKRDGYGRLVLGDVITSLNGQKVTNGSDLYKILDRCKVGDKVEVEILRGDKKIKVPVTLEARE
ncbi:hypothetical protein R1sor_016944 [Riccia sorocarpa]|uniref:PDZ domain-containing protein n=1 Tax=Riccia sorocarpa TaxID=122646 RepID=A0ABD3I9D0_9MARC